MPNITITQEAHAVIRANTQAGYAFRDTGTRLPDGRISIPVESDVLERLDEVKHPGESYSDVIVRICSTAN